MNNLPYFSLTNCVLAKEAAGLINKEGNTNTNRYYPPIGHFRTTKVSKIDNSNCLFNFSTNLPDSTMPTVRVVMLIG